jgi:hypothetical protein
MNLQHKSMAAGTFTGTTEKYFQGWKLVDVKGQNETPPSGVRAGRTGEQGEQACEQPEGGWPESNSNFESDTSSRIHSDESSSAAGGPTQTRIHAPGLCCGCRRETPSLRGPGVVEEKKPRRSFKGPRLLRADDSWDDSDDSSSAE